VLEGGCQRQNGQEPFAPLRGALEGYLRRQPPAQLQADLEGCAWLVRLLPELAETTLLPVLPSGRLAPADERRLMFQAVGRMLANVRGRAGTLLVLDDLQWAGADALNLLETLVRQRGEVPLRVVGAYRDTELAPERPLGMLLADLGHDDLVAELQVGPLPPDAARALLGRLLERPAAAEEPTEGVHTELTAHERATPLEQLIERAGGVPFYLVSSAQAWRVGVSGATRGSRAAGAVPATKEAVPWNVSQHVRQRIAALPQAAREIVGIAAVAGRQSPRSAILGVAARYGLSPSEALAALESALHQRLLREEAGGRCAFVHDLIREVVLAGLSSARQAAWHLALGEALERLPMAQRQPAELAWHFAEAGEPARALPYALLAGDQAEAVFAHAEAEQHYQQAIALAAVNDDHAQAAEARMRLGHALTVVGRSNEAVAMLEAAIVIYRTLGDREGGGRAERELAITRYMMGMLDDSIAHILAARDLLQSSAAPDELASIHTWLASAYWFLSRHDEALAAAQTAVTYAEAAANSGALALARLPYGAVLIIQGRIREGCAMLEESLAAVLPQGDPTAAGLALDVLMDGYEALGDFTAARCWIERAIEQAERTSHGVGKIWMRYRHGLNAYYTGAWEQAEADFEESIALSRALNGALLPYPTFSRGHLLMLRGNPTEPEDRERAEIWERGPAHTVWLVVPVRAEQLLLAGSPESARALLQSYLPQDKDSTSKVIRLLPWLALAELELGHEAEAAEVLTRCIARAREMQHGFVLVDALRVRALLAMKDTRWDDAETDLDEALALARVMPYPYAEAKALYVYGLAHARKGEVETARERLETAQAILAQMGERPYTAHVERALAELGASGPAAPGASSAAVEVTREVKRPRPQR
jgi:tetratricopeptide (TPR) repeat protein